MDQKGVIDKLKELEGQTKDVGQQIRKLMNQFELSHYDLFKSDEFDFLYPNYLDPEFNFKIANKKEFYESKYDDVVKDIISESQRLENAEFELAPHQIFVRNFLSYQTPYNSLLLYHGLGTGKTCSGISIAEEMRDYNKVMNIQKKIIIVASPNVQENFKKQLFDESKLKKVNGLWDLKGCVGNKLLNEINPMQLLDVPKEKLILQVKTLIKQNYIFVGYEKLANIVLTIEEKYKGVEDVNKRQAFIERAIQREFNDRLLIVDEIHNIRSSNDSSKKKVASNFMKIVKNATNMRLLLLSATPMFNSYKEIIFLLNLLLMNDKRPTVELNDIFDTKGNFKIDERGNEIGKLMLISKSRGYISFVKGESPYSFPFAIYPRFFNITNSIQNPDFIYPRQQINGNPILNKIDFLDVYLSNMNDYQKTIYDVLLGEMQESLPESDELDTGLGWQVINKPVQILNMVYPHDDIDQFIESGDTSKLSINEYIGSNGLKHIMNYNTSKKSGFSYKTETLDKYGRVFSHENIGNYSHKISSFLSNLKRSTGIVLIYSQYIDGGCVPIALALEELGFRRYGNGKSLFKTPQDSVDYKTFLSKKEHEDRYPDVEFKQASYIMITGDKALSPKNSQEIRAVTSPTNVYGEDVKVIIISESGSEGIDFNNIRQVHILDPWYNNNRNEQTIGRAIRFRSHKLLPLAERNANVYLYGTQPYNEIETLDLYVYRNAEKKSIKIGVVSRLLKENAVDCLLNTGINDTSAKKLNQSLDIVLSNGKKINYIVGDKPYSNICDYMENCDYKCIPELSDREKGKLGDNSSSFDYDFIQFNLDKLIQKVGQIFKEQFIIKKDSLIQELNRFHTYPLSQIDAALHEMIHNKNEFIVDMFGNRGKLMNIGEYYFFQHIELGNSKISVTENSKPIDYKRTSLIIKLPDSIGKSDFALDDEELKEYVDEAKEDITKDDDEIVDLTQIKKKPSLKTKKQVKLPILESMKNNIDTAFKPEVIPRGNVNYYENARMAMSYFLSKKMMDKEELEYLMVSHIIDSMSFDKKKGFLIELIENEDLAEETYPTLFEACDRYIDENIKVKKDGIEAYLLVQNKKLKLYNYQNGDLLELPPVQQKSLLPVLLKKQVKPDDYNVVVGFMIEFKNTGNIVFKSKDLDEKRNKGARCDQAAKHIIIRLINKQEGEELFTKENSKLLSKLQLCIIQEFLLRYHNDEEKEDKVWFLTHEDATLNKFEDL